MSIPEVTLTAEQLGIVSDDAKSRLIAASVEASKTGKPVTVDFGNVSLTIAPRSNSEVKHD